MDLRQQLNRDLKRIEKKYADYVDCIRAIVEEKGISTEQLSSYLINLPAFTDNRKKPQLLSDIRSEFQKEQSIAGIFSLLSSKYSCFIDYDIFETILKKYGPHETHETREALSYPEDLEAYLKKQQIKDFVKIHPDLANPKLEKFICDGTLKKLHIKLSVEQTQNLHTISEVTEAVANILGLRASALQLHGIKEGCVLVTLLISASIADSIFASEVALTSRQIQDFQAASVLWLECKNYSYDFSKGSQEKHQENSSGIVIL